MEQKLPGWTPGAFPCSSDNLSSSISSLRLAQCRTAISACGLTDWISLQIVGFVVHVACIFTDFAVSFVRVQIFGLKETVQFLVDCAAYLRTRMVDRLMVRSLSETTRFLMHVLSQ